MISTIFYTFFYQPIVNALILVYNFLPFKDFGVSIIILTVIIRFLLYPVSAKATKSQKLLAEIQPKQKEIQEKYKNDKEKQAMETLNLYKEAKITPFSGFLPILIQLPVMLALYRALWGVQNLQVAEVLYKFVSFPKYINSLFLGIADLSKVGFISSNGGSHLLWGNLILIIGAGASQLFQTKMLQRKNKNEEKKEITRDQEMVEKMQKQMMYFLPFFTIFILFKLPSAIALYWLTSTLFSIIQQYFILKKS